jgi:hypothetical protein
MTPRFSIKKLKETAFRDYAVRFVFGGFVSAAAAALGKHFGPIVGGVFLAFPALLPASLTLVKEHEGRKSALDDARGAVLGSFGLAAFAAVVASFGRAWAPPIVLGAALLAWGFVSVVLWWAFLGLRPR